MARLMCILFTVGSFCWAGVELGAGEAIRWAKYHAWGNFPVGAWKTVRMVTESLDEQGNLLDSSITETTTTLTARDANGLTLLVEAVVELADKRLTVVPRTVRQDYFGLSAGAQVRIKSAGTAQLEIEGRKIPVQVHQAEETTPAGRTITSIYFSDQVPPYVLRREIRTTDPEGKTLQAETISAVVALGLPWRVVSEIKQTALVHTLHKEAKGSVETWAVVCAEVPGGVVCQASKEYDEAGRLVRRSAMELVDYSLRPPQEFRRGLFSRLRAKRAQKTDRRP